MFEKAAPILRQGGVGVAPTDTIYGLVGSAFSLAAVTRIYRLRRRDPKKPCIILIGDWRDLARFGLKLTTADKKILRGYWPGPVSVTLPLPPYKSATTVKDLYYLHRGQKSLAFRLPRPRWLRRLLRQTGPLVAPSANLAGQSPAATIKEARAYFGNQVDFYLSAGGRVTGKPSTLIKISRGKIAFLRC